MRKWFAPQNAGTFHCNGASAVGVFGADKRGVGVLCANGLAKFRSANATPDLTMLGWMAIGYGTVDGCGWSDTGISRPFPTGCGADRVAHAPFLSAVVIQLESKLKYAEEPMFIITSGLKLVESAGTVVADQINEHSRSSYKKNTP